MNALRRYAPSVAGFVVVLLVGLGLGSIVVPPVVDTLVPLTPMPVDGSELGASPTPSPVAGILMNGVAVGEKADCAGCHKTENGTLGVALTPPLAHPLKGWTRCLACHSDSRLVPTARGHRDFTEDQCLACHREQGQGNAPSRPHHVYPGQQCTSCHNGTKAPLPKEMAARNACWLCHHEAPGASAFPSVPPDASPPAGAGQPSQP